MKFPELNRYGMKILPQGKPHYQIGSVAIGVGSVLVAWKNVLVVLMRDSYIYEGCLCTTGKAEKEKAYFECLVAFYQREVAVARKRE